MKPQAKRSLPPYLYQDRVGTIYFRRRGRPQIKMRCQNPDTANFASEYNGYLDDEEKPRTKRTIGNRYIHPRHYAGMQAAARKRAKRQGVPFELPAGWCEMAAGAQGHCCAVSGVLFSITQQKRSPNMPSLDRIDPSKGYTPENCRLVTYIVNCALNAFGDDELLSMCQAVVRMNAK